MKKLLSIFSIVALNKVVNDSSGMLFRGEILVSLRGGIADEAVSRQLSFARNDKKEPQTLISILKRGRAPCMSDRPLNLTMINSWYYFMMVLLMMKEANTMETMERSFIRMLMEGPDVSLKGSPTVSPTTAAL